MNVRKYVYLLGVRVRNNYIIPNLRFLLQSQKLDINSLQNYQYAKLKELLEHAYKESEYYKNVFDKNNIHPNDIETLGDLKKIPYLTKDDLLKNTQKIQIRNGSEKLFYSETSGSTGKPLVFFRNKSWDAWHRASVFRGYLWHGVKLWEKNGYLWGYNFALAKRLKTRILDCLQNRFRLFSYKDDEINKFITKLTKATYLGGYSSMIYEVAKRVNSISKNNTKFNLKMIKGTSEKILDKYQDEVQDAFGSKIISEYGSAEAGIIAFECIEGNMHINMETVIVEQEANEIIVTNLVSHSFPIIRYKLGDYIEIDNHTHCKCGMQHQIIKEIAGRVGGKIYGYKNQYPSLTIYYVFKNLAMGHDLILNYQVVQLKKGELIVYIENELSNDDKTLLLNEFGNYFNDDIRLNIIDRSDLSSKDMKKKDFISKISAIQGN
ncbi:MAG: phenylacetate--CoA ligase family protein [Desulfobacteraceae bacterium]|nr:phenylacetate--CoA ligase family protein [Desulfobacteraceae bacterium]MBC2720923.1 phenylacetate--CoA ligase family protein [Desulfobacteraceae bacterium]